ncbi:serine hydrolase domain-containing protein [Nocardia sp. NPDC088792]|uniref:serine hydrolase domain-containing protein n=1 Tax=Nocardia sp. NPDC088792 TaxID=3364332 RepID=UPI0037F9C143
MRASTFRWRGRHRAALALVLGATLLATVGCGKTTTNPNPTAPQPAEVSDALTALVRSGIPGAQAVITGSDGRHTVTAGAGDLATGAPYPEGAHIRIGSVTKTFVATVVLQLVAEGAVDLDAPIERYLPGVVQGNGNDGTRVTVHELLQHTSGLPDFAPEDVSQKLPQQLDQTSDGKAYRDFTPADLVRIAMTMPPQFEPGAQFRYTNTNYVLLDMLIEHVTGHPLAAEIGTRILDPLALRDTYFPLPGDTALRDPHPLGYHKVDGNWVDVTGMEAAWAGAAGAMISTGADLNHFFTALLSGKLLPPAQLTQMKQTLPMTAEMNYGLGLIRFQMSCGKESRDVWGHAGGIPGFSTVTFITPQGAAVTMSVNTEDPNPGFSNAILAISCAVA